MRLGSCNTIADRPTDRPSEEEEIRSNIGSREVSQSSQALRVARVRPREYNLIVEVAQQYV